MDHLICEPPSGDIAILLNLGLVDRLQGIMREARDREIGGILWGQRDSQSGISGRRIIIIEDFEPVESGAGENALSTGALSGPRAQDGHVPVGFFRSHAKKNLSPDEADFSLFREYFSSSASVLLIARPEPNGVPMAGFSYWEDGTLDGRSKCAEFPLDRRTLEKGGYSLLRGSFARAEVPVLTAAPRPMSTLRAKVRLTKRAVYATIGGVLILGTLIGAAMLHFSGRAEDASTLALSVERRGNTLRLSWDPNAPAIEHATNAILWISDGEKRRGLELNAARLKGGSYSYTPEGTVVSFRLDVLKTLAQGSESVHYVAERGTPPPVAAPSTKPSLPEATVAEAPRQPPPAPAAMPVRAEPAVSITTQPLPSSRVREWMAKVPLMRRLQRSRYRNGDGFLPPRAVREVLPRVPARLARELPPNSRVDLKVSLDANGTVREIDLVSPGGDERLAKIGADALRQWRFEPARLRDKPIPCDLLATLNFRNPPSGGLVAQRE